MISPPPFQFLPVPNMWKGRFGYTPIAIVNHITQGSRGSVIYTFENTAIAVSAHFMVCKDGSIINFVNTDDTAWGNGIPDKPDMKVPWLADAINKGINPNYLTISIEHEGLSGVALTEAQYQSSLMLQRFLVARYKIAVDRDHIIGHYRIDSVDRANCPGAAYPWDRLLKDLTPVAPVPAPLPRVWHCSVPNRVYDVSDANGILSHYEQYGGLISFGYPLSNEFVSTIAKDEQGLAMRLQVFEREILGIHPKDGKPWNVQGFLISDPNFAAVINDAKARGGMHLFP